jgi:hypothetical protein
LVLGDDAFFKSDPGTTLPDGLNPESVDLKTHTAISSITVEPSYSSDNPALVARHTTEPELRPATEVFGFLLDKRRSRRSISMNMGRPLTAPSTPWDLKSSKDQVYDVPATPFSARQLPPNSSDLRPVGGSALADSPSTVGSILVDPPHTAAILNHTRIPVAQGSRIGQQTATGVTTRASRIPRGRHSLQLDTWTPTSEIYVPTTAPAELSNPSAPACRSDALSPASNAIKRPSVVTTLVPPKQDASFAQVPMRSTHRRSVSHGTSRPPSTYRDMGFDATKMARVKGLKSASGNKENILSDVGNAGIRVFSSFSSMLCHWLTSLSADSSRNPKSRLPMTPSRGWAPFSSAPSPASSSELSPVGQKMMTDLRKVRQARNERRTNRLTEAVIAHV